MAFLFKSYDYTALSLSHLLTASDIYHLHLMNEQNVLATTIAYCRICKVENWGTSENSNSDILKTDNHINYSNF